MRTYILNNQDRVSIARSALRLTVSTQVPTDDVVLTARRGGRVDPTAIRPARTLMILPPVADRTVVLVEPRSGLGAFAPNTVVSLTIQADLPGADSDTVLVHAVDVSGLPECELALLDMDADGQLSVSAAAGEDVPLPELAAAARTEARTELARAGIDDNAAIDMVVGIDTSASMAHVIADGSVGAVLEVLAGVWHAVGRDRRFEVCLMGDRPRWLVDVPFDVLAAAATREIVTRGLGCGFRSAAAELDRPYTNQTVTYVITDGPPADLPVLASRRGGNDVRHLVLLSYVSVPRTAAVPWTGVGPPRAGVAAAAHLMQSRHELSALVASLLVSCYPERSAPAGWSAR